MKKLHLAIAASTAALAFSGLAPQAQAFTLDFDGLASGNPASLAAPAGFTINFGELVPTTDEFGDQIGTETHWQISLGPVPTVNNPLTNSWGPAPSGSLAIDARFGDLLLGFSSPVSLGSFSVTLDNSAFGSLQTQQILFLGSDFSTTLASINIQQSTPGLVAITGPVANVSAIVLPGSAYYDNLAINVVPEPGAIVSMMGGAAMLLGVLRRRRLV